MGTAAAMKAAMTGKYCGIHRYGTKFSIGRRAVPSRRRMAPPRS
jgi:hypothetical protein